MYKFTMIVTMIVVIVSMTICCMVMTWLTESDFFKIYVVIQMIMGGFFSTGYSPLCISYGSELTFPIQPSLVNGMFTLSNAFAGFGLAFIGSFLTKEKATDVDLKEDELILVKRSRARAALSIAVFASLISLALSFVIKEDLKRLKYRKDQKEN